MVAIPNSWRVDRPAQDRRLALVERIVSSERFHKAPQLRDILVYVSVRSLTESPATISEQQIGSIVLDRGPEFDPRQDNIVRAQMRHLRIKLEEYFQEEGKEEQLVLTIPKGHYVAHFEPRPTVKRLAPARGSEVAAAPLSQARRKWIGAALILIAILAAALFGAQLQLESPETTPVSYSYYDEVLGPMGQGPSSEALLVLGNPVVLLYAGSPSESGEAIGATDGIPIPAELAPRFEEAANRADKVMPYHRLQIKKNDYTGLGDAAGCFHLGQLMKVLGRRMEVTQSRFLSWDSARRRDLIILGSPHTNEWAHGNVPKHKYRIVKMGIKNTDPQPGEPALYPITYDSTGTPLVDHGLVWGWKSPAGSRVFVLAGPSSAATGAMARLFSDPDRFRPIYEKLKADALGDEFPPNWQVLMKVDVRDNLPIRTTYVTHQVFPSDS